MIGKRRALQCGWLHPRAEVSLLLLVEVGRLQLWLHRFVGQKVQLLMQNADVIIITTGLESV